jgi:type IV secretion system protein VirB4
MIFEREFRDTLEGFADLLQYVAVIDRRRGIVIGKAGQLMASFAVMGRDADSSSARDLEAISQRVNAGLKRLGHGWMLHFNAFRFESRGYPKAGYFPDPATRVLDEERRRMYEGEGRHFESQRVLTLTWLPPPPLENKVKSLVREASEDMVPESLPAEQKKYFIQTIDDIASELRLEFVAVEPLVPQVIEYPNLAQRTVIDPQLGVFHWCATGVRQQIALPPPDTAPFAIDYLIGNQDFVGGDQPRVGNKHIKVIAVDSLPSEGTHAAILEILNRLGVAYRWSTRFIFVDDEHAEAVMDRHYAKWNQQVRKFLDQALNRVGGRINEEALRMSNDAQAAKNELRSKEVKFGYYTGAIVLYGENLGSLEADAQQVIDALRQKHFVARDENINAVEAFLGTLPGHGWENVRRPMIHTLNLADLIPTTAPWQGLEQNPCDKIKNQYPDQHALHVPPHFYAVSSGSTPFRCSLHVGDVGHTLMVGRTGGGKSTMLGFLMAQWFRYPNAKVFAFDKGWSAYALNQACGGTHYNIMGEGTDVGFFPLGEVHKVGERAWAESWIEAMLVLNNVEVTSSRRTMIRTTLAALGREDRDLRTLTHFAGMLQDTEMAQALRYYTTGVGAGGILDGTGDTVDLTRFTVFEMEALMELDDRHVAPVLMYLFRVIERQLDGSPVMIVLDEAWLMLKHALFQEILQKWLKVLRKANAFVVFATQELADLDQSPIRDTIYSACMTRIFLPDRDADTDVSVPYYQRLGLTPRQIKLVTKGVQKRDYYYTSPYGSRMFQLGLGRAALSLVGVAGIENTRRIQELQREFGDAWISQWMRELDVTEEVVQLLENYQKKASASLRDQISSIA